MSERVRGRLAVAAPPLVSLLLGAVVHARVPMARLAADAYVYSITAAGLVGQNADPSFRLHWSIANTAEHGLYPAVVGAVYAIAGEPKPAAVGWLQALVMVPLTTYLIYLAGREALSRRVGLVSAWAFALWVPAQWYTLWLLSETLTNLLMAAALAFLAGLLARKSKLLALSAGLALGVVSLAHPAYQFLALVVVLALVVHFLAHERRHLRLVFPVVLGICAVQIPHLVAVQAASLPSLGQGGTGLADGGGWTFWAASDASNGFVPVPDDYRVADLAPPGALVSVAGLIDRAKIHVDRHLAATIRRKRALPDAMHQTLRDGDYYRAGIANLLDRPGKWPEKVKGNASRLFLLPGELQFYRDRPLAHDWRTNGKWPFYERDHLTHSTWFLRPWRLLSALLAVCALSGLLCVLVRRRDRLVLFVPLIFQTAVLIALLVEWRYVVPLWSSLFVLAGVGTVGWGERRAYSNARDAARTAQTRVSERTAATTSS